MTNLSITKPLPEAAGNFARLRQRRLMSPCSLQDYKVVEYLLALAVPRHDAKSLLRTQLGRINRMRQKVDHQHNGRRSSTR